MKIEVRRRKLHNIPKLTSARVKVGFPLGTSSDALMKATLNHFGTRNIPERPFLDNAIRDNASKYKKHLRSSAASILRGETTTEAAVSALGPIAAAHIKAEILGMVPPPNDADTIERKGHGSTLVESGDMVGSVTWRKA